MTRSPEHYEPRRHPERARRRRDVVLRTLVEAGVVEAEEAEQAAREPLALAPVRPASTARSYASAAVTRELRRVAPRLAGEPALHVFTTLDSATQASAGAELSEQLIALEGIRKRRGPRGTGVGDLDGRGSGHIAGQRLRLGAATGRHACALRRA